MRSKNTGERMAELILAKHVRDGVLTVGICDKEHVGKVYEEGNKQIDTTGDFFDGEKVSADEIKEALPKAKSATIVGKESVAIASEVYENPQVLVVDDIPLISIFKV